MSGPFHESDQSLPIHLSEDPTALRGLTFLNTRDAQGAERLTRLLVKTGGRVIEKPMLVFAPPVSWEPFDSRLADLQQGDWVIFTSATAVRSTLARLKTLNKDMLALSVAKVAAVGKSTATTLRDVGLMVDLVPERFQAEELLEALIPLLQQDDRVWFPRAEKGRETLVEGLRAHGVHVDMTPVYRTVPPEGGLGQVAEMMRKKEVDWLLFTSSLTVEHFLNKLQQEPDGTKLASHCRVGCIGQITAQTAKDNGLKVEVVPEQQDLPGLVEALIAHVRSDNHRS